MTDAQTTRGSIRRIGAPSGTVAPPATRPVGEELSWTKVAWSLGAVIGIILVLRWAGARLFGAGAGARSSRAIRVVSRAALGPKQQLVLVQVGRRLVLAANSGAQVNPLCEITEADEVAELLGQIQRERGEAAGNAFAAWFGKAQAPFGPEGKSDGGVDDGAEPAVDPEAAVTRQELHGLMDKVKLLSKQFRS